METLPVIVTRHPAACEFVARHLGPGWRVGWLDGRPATVFCDGLFYRVLAQAGPEDVRGRVVYGNLPLHLAALAASVYAIEFGGAPPRGQEYSLADMDAAGAVLRRYKVLTEERVLALRHDAHMDGYGPDPSYLISLGDD